MEYSTGNAFRCHGDDLGRLSVAVAKESIIAGCVSCKLAIDIVEAFKPGWTSEEEQAKQISFSEVEGQWRLHERDKFTECFTVHYLPEERSDCAFAFERARQWLSRCVRHDNDCRPDETGGPRRLLQLLSSDISSVRLIELEESTKPPKYACLSYCWGSDISDILTTTRDNIHSHLNGIQVDKLPKTIADAIKVCRELRIDYLWVDSLCIIQRDGDDFAAEGSKMDLIYANSHLTLYAKAPRSCKEGFLGPQTRGSRQRQWPAPRRAPNGLRFIVRAASSTETNDEVAALETRGWCFQESILPKRQLIYWGLEMEWNCLCRRICECGFVTRDRYRRDRYPGDALNDQKAQYHVDGPMKTGHLPTKFISEELSIYRQKGEAHFDHVTRWHEFINEYSGRGLSNPGDRLPALAGLAKRLLQMAEDLTGIRDRYYAGLFGMRFVDSLCWSCDTTAHEDWDGSSPPHHPQQETPSWSWASVQKRVSFTERPDPAHWLVYGQAEAIIHEIFCEPAHPNNPMGAIKHGYIDITAPILSVKLAKPEAEPGSPWLSANIFWFLASDEDFQKAHIVFDTEQELQRLLGDNHRSKDIAPRPKAKLYGRKYDLRVLRDQYFACRLRTWMWRYRGESRSSHNHTDFLILQKTPDDNTYRRVGFGYFEVKVSGHTFDGDPLFTASVAERRIRIV
ncbi:heterokaryon incompatibility protein-domain-containing protein [Achaetomium macrosporum]|uniref:Heterokaryon incompatibility protein-domain-containing protein n=1 Tax=Achaetomium macrosporum TaxID=79813 RepID=A0AAN7H8J2_9PEZI|nr:heterokaryon incompatibility protein-domain-containing protein [Achaetomium macrosporum]